MNIDCPVSLGELVDKLTILEIKCEMIADPIKVDHATKERDALEQKLHSLELDSDLRVLREELKEVNLTLWKIEDDIRLKEKAKEFDQDFISLARSVYQTNDRRFAIKNKINQRFSSGFMEVKSYEDYQ